MSTGAAVPESGYKLTERSLTLLEPPAGDFELEVVTALKPQDNSLLEGLYKSSGNYCTQVRLEHVLRWTPPVSCCCCNGIRRACCT